MENGSWMLNAGMYRNVENLISIQESVTQFSWWALAHEKTCLTHVCEVMMKLVTGENKLKMYDYRMQGKSHLSLM